MEATYFTQIVQTVADQNFIWILIPIFFIGIITDKYQEEMKTSIGSAISNGALVIFSGFTWIQVISSRPSLPLDITLSQYLLSLIMISYGFTIIGSGFKSGKFAKKYGRIRVITYMLMFFSTMIYIPQLYKFLGVVILVFTFPLYYALISQLIKILPEAASLKKSKKAHRR